MAAQDRLFQLDLWRRQAAGEMAEILGKDAIEADRFAVSRLVGKLANVCPDLPSSDLVGTSMFKALTGGDRVTAEYKYRDSFDFEPFARLIFSANSLPRSGDMSSAFYRRWIVVPFERTFEEGTRGHVPSKELDARLSNPSELSRSSSQRSRSVSPPSLLSMRSNSRSSGHSETLA